jgi:hypothetical protein
MNDNDRNDNDFYFGSRPSPYTSLLQALGPLRFVTEDHNQIEVRANRYTGKITITIERLRPFSELKEMLTLTGGNLIAAKMRGDLDVYFCLQNNCNYALLSQAEHIMAKMPSDELKAWNDAVNARQSEGAK